MACLTIVRRAVLATHLIGSAVLLSGCGSSGSPAPSPSPSPPTCEGVQEWGDQRCFGTAPVCTTSADDCYEHHMDYVDSSKDCHGQESSCLTGEKVSCKPISSCCPGYGFQADGSSPPLCNKCAQGTHAPGGLHACEKCACDDPSETRIGCSDSEPGHCTPTNCLFFQSATSCPSGASQPCVFSVTHSSSSSSGDSITVGQSVTLSAADMLKIQTSLSDTSFHETTINNTVGSVIALKPGASSCVFQSVEMKLNGPAVCQQPEISGNTDTGTSGKQCYIADSNPAYDFPVCNTQDVCGTSTLLGRVSMV